MLLERGMNPLDSLLGLNPFRHWQCAKVARHAHVTHNPKDIVDIAGRWGAQQKALGLKHWECGKSSSQVKHIFPAGSIVVTGLGCQALGSHGAGSQWRV